MGNFTFNETSIEGVYKIDVKKYGDNRGYFMETYKKEDFDKAGLVYNFVQD
ncbi:MAG: dTDP-4-dehydrorhamnose 3,5-epimerase family protein, partial [Bacilli bacterium]|nr:dTDP-4-dehydrorhamnose 3,5-epimerase family protein [Bacilli bacterium]